MASASKEKWSAGQLYEPYVGRWSRAVAKDFLRWLNPSPDARWLDVGCGTGALTGTILAQCRPGSVMGVDSSAGFVEHARAQIPDARAAFRVGDAQSLPEDSATVDYAVSGLVLNFLPAPSRGAAEMKRALRPGGVAAAYVWDYAGRMELMRYFWDAAAALDPAALPLDEGRRFPLCQPEALAALFREVGLRDVEVRSIDVPTVFRDFDDYWSPFLGGQGPAPGYAMSLPEEQRARLRERLRSALPRRDDGAIALTARAWAVRGKQG